jgi:hypothetical protein
MPGPPPKPASQRRRHSKPKSYGAAEPTAIGAAPEQPAELGFERHSLIADLWSALVESGESKFYSAADWQRVRLELWYGNQLVSSVRTPGAQAWATFQSGLQALLVSPAEKRRLGIEARPPVGEADEDAVVLMLAKYKAELS